MNDRREALRSRFRARAADKVRAVSLGLIELEEGRGTPAMVQDLARELHTLKGDARMLGFARLSELAHAAEGVLAAARAGGATPDGRSCSVINRELELVGGYLRGELGDAAAAEAALVGARDRLAAALLIPAERLPAPAEPVRPPPGAAALPVPPAAIGDRVSAAATPETPPGPATDRYMQVNVARIDDLCERVFEFVADFRALRAQAQAVGRAAKNVALRGVLEDFDRRRAQLDDLTGAAWSLRLSPVEPWLEELVRHARDLGRGQGKRLRVSVRAAGAELERRVLDDLWEPLLHLVRNAVDHGLEPPTQRGEKPSEGTLELSAEAVGPNVLLTVTDDGRGIDAQAVRTAAVRRGLVAAERAETLSSSEVFDFLFVHGFSTREEVTDVSGRGVGLDVVRGAVESVGGSVAVESTVGKGSRFLLTVPAAISKERSLVVACDGVLYAIPARHVLEVVRRSDARVEPVAGGTVLRYRGEAVPLRSMSASLARTGQGDEPWLAILDWAGHRHALGVPEVVGENDLVRRPTDALVARAGYVAASATLDDGRLVLVVSVAGLLRRTLAREAAAVVAAAPAPIRRKQVLVVDDSPMARDLLAEILSGSGLEVVTVADGRQALAALERNVPDLVLADVEMPGVDGLELLRRVRERWRHLPVVMLTTRGSAEDKRAAASLGADAYLVKSEFEEAGLLGTIRRFLGETP